MDLPGVYALCLERRVMTPRHGSAPISAAPAGAWPCQVFGRAWDLAYSSASHTRSHLMPLITHAAGDVTAISDRPAQSMSGYAVLVGGFVLLVLAAYLGWLSFGRTSAGGLLATAILVFCIVVWKGLYVLQPNYSAVMQLFGSYIGTDATTGLRWVNPFYA